MNDDIKCYDPLPFAVLGLNLTYVGCTEARPIGEKFEAFLYSCSYAVKMSTLHVTPIVTGLLQEFAISFRVQEWSNSQYGVIVFPQDTSDPWPINTKAMLNFRLPSMYIWSVVLIAPEKLTNQTFPDLMLSAAFDRDLEGEGLSDAYRIPLYVGADPGINNKNLLLASRDFYLIHLHCSVVSIISRYKESDIYLTFYFNQQGAINGYDTDFRDLLLISPKFPWVFDEPGDVYFSTRTGIKLGEEFIKIDVELTVIEGGTLLINDEEALGNYTKKFTATDLGATFHLNVREIAAVFEPDLAHDGPRGFLVHVGNTAKRIARETCVQNITLTRENPLFTINQIQGQLICVKIGDDVADHENAIIVIFCNLKQKNDPDSETPIKGCIYYDLDLTYSKQICCRMVFNATRNRYTQIRLNNEYSSLLVRAATFCPGMSFSISMEQDTIVLMAFCYRYSSLWIQLGQLQWAHSENNCEYQLYSGAISRPDAKLPLATFRDVDPFIPQFIPGGVYSIFIPKGCNPVVATKTVSYDDDIQVPTNQCKGMALDVGPAFGDPFTTSLKQRTHQSFGNAVEAWLSRQDPSFRTLHKLPIRTESPRPRHARNLGDGWHFGSVRSKAFWRHYFANIAAKYNFSCRSETSSFVEKRTRI
ncbi:unnamed protein product, partial [Mesorhabditis spiculigera]